MSSLSTITVGNFDGVHLGHAELVRKARRAIGDDGIVRVLSFDPHPSTVLNPGDLSSRLSSFSQRTKWLEGFGADEVIRLQPTPEFLSRSPEEFICWLVENHHPSIIVEGPDFRFGSARSGSIDTLRELQGKYDYKTLVIDPVEASLTDGSLVQASSSLIRWLIRQGRVRDALNLLGHPYELQSNVVEGDKRGRTLGIPTANLDHGCHLLPADGIYMGVATMPDGRDYPAAVSIGTKPTFGEHPRVCEAHLIGYEPPTDEYGWTMKLLINDWLRDQITYDAPGPLINQIHRDIERVNRESSHESVLLQHHD